MKFTEKRPTPGILNAYIYPLSSFVSYFSTPFLFNKVKGNELINMLLISKVA